MPSKKAYKSGRFTRNLPILVDRQNNCITAGEFKSYGGDWVQVFESLWMDEACHVEACLQRATQHLKKGRRLFHAVAMGAKYTQALDKDHLDGEIYKVFVTFIASSPGCYQTWVEDPKIQKEERRIKINVRLC